MNAVSYLLNLFGYISMGLLVVGLFYRVMKWWMAGVPFRLTKFPAAASPVRAFGRLLLDSFFFRSLWRRDMEMWLAGWSFHLLLLLLLLGHWVGIATLGTQFVNLGMSADASRELSAGCGMIIGGLLLLNLFYLLLRRWVNRPLRLISRGEDYLVLFLLMAIVGSGFSMRLAGGEDLAQVRSFMAGLVSLRPAAAPEGIGFRIHFVLVCVFMAWFPFSKLVHSCGIFMSRWLVTRTYPRQVLWK